MPNADVLFFSYVNLSPHFLSQINCVLAGIGDPTDPTEDLLAVHHFVSLFSVRLNSASIFLCSVLCFDGVRFVVDDDSVVFCVCFFYVEVDAR